MSQLKNSRVLKTIWREPVDVTPIWLMRQAGRYLPEYRATRAQAGSFIRLCKTPELACEVTLQPLQRFALDAAIIFSDILTIPDAMGFGLDFVENHGPILTRSISQQRDLSLLENFDLERLTYVYETIRLVRQNLSVPLIGFCGSPWTVAAYMVEGRSQLGFPKIMQMRADHPELLCNLLNKLSEAILAHLKAQVEAGIHIAMIFDTWGGLLNTKEYEKFSLFYIKQIITRLKSEYCHYYNNKGLPVILFTKGGDRSVKQMLETGCDVMGIDWETSLREVRKEVQDRIAIQGNMHPNCLLQSPSFIRTEVTKILDSYGKGSGHIFNLGHGLTPDAPPEHVRELVDAVHELSKPYHRGK